jgi:hypothetical protein
MRVWTVRVLLLGVLSALLVLAVAGQSAISGPVVFTIVEDRHGVHLSDIVAFVLWCVGLGAVAKVR